MHRKSTLCNVQKTINFIRYRCISNVVQIFYQDVQEKQKTSRDTVQLILISVYHELLKQTSAFEIDNILNQFQSIASSLYIVMASFRFAGTKLIITVRKTNMLL